MAEAPKKLLAVIPESAGQFTVPGVTLLFSRDLVVDGQVRQELIREFVSQDTLAERFNKAAGSLVVSAATEAAFWVAAETAKPLNDRLLGAMTIVQSLLPAIEEASQ